MQSIASQRFATKAANQMGRCVGLSGTVGVVVLGFSIPKFTLLYISGCRRGIKCSLWRLGPRVYCRYRGTGKRYPIRGSWALLRNVPGAPCMRRNRSITDAELRPYLSVGETSRHESFRQFISGTNAGLKSLQDGVFGGSRRNRWEILQRFISGFAGRIGPCQPGPT